MNKRTLERAITRELARKANAADVDVEHDRVFVGRGGPVLHVLTFKLLDAQPPVRCLPVLGVIIPVAERVLREVNENRKSALTLAQDAGNRFVPCRRVTIDRADATAVASALWQVFDATADAYFRTRQDLGQIERTLNTELDIVVPDAADIVRRAEVGIVLARLTGRPDFESIVSAYLQRVIEFYRPDLEALAARCRGDISLK
jgi:hypothetical protein